MTAVSNKKTCQTNKTDAKTSKADANNFPARLHYMLRELEKDGFEHVISWRPHGRAFMVVDQEAFAKDILPLWFRQSKYSSFQRQLNLYGFKRIGSGPDKGSHYHENFLRGMPSLTSKIVRTKVKGTGTRKPRSTTEAEPDFYAMPASVPSSTSTTTATSQPTMDDSLSSSVTESHQDKVMMPTKSSVPAPVAPQPVLAKSFGQPETMHPGSSIDQLLALAMAQRQMEQNLLALHAHATLQRRLSDASLRTTSTRGGDQQQPQHPPSPRSPSPTVSSGSSQSRIPLTTEQSLLLAHLIGTNAI